MRGRQFYIVISTICGILHLTHATTIPLPKIGTWEKNYKSYWIGLNGAHAKTATKEDEASFLKTLQQRLNSYMVPPKKFAIYEMRSEFLGLMGLVVDTPASLQSEDAIFDTAEKFSDSWTSFYMPCLFMLKADEGSSGEDTPGQVIEVEDLGVKQSVEGNLNRRDTRGQDGQDSKIERRNSALHDLVTLSTPPGVSQQQMRGIFWQWKKAGEGVTVYVVDSGCDPRHPEFKNTKFQDWIFPGPMTLTEPRDDSDLPESNEFHGTPVTAKIVGEKTGVAQKANVVVVNMIAGNARQGFGHDLYKAHDCLLKIYDHVKKNSRNGSAKCMINISYAWIPLEHLKSINVEWASEIERYSRYIFSQLVELGCYFTIASGNSGQVSSITPFLRLYGTPVIKYLIYQRNY
ncbi:hypothetical protein TWF281_011587 [Arthrobotrys megalospora]